MNQQMEMNKSTIILLGRISVLDGKFRRAMTSLKLLNQRITSQKTRYDRIRRRLDKLPFSYAYKIQLSTLESMRDIFAEYAHRLAEQLEELEWALIADSQKSGLSGEAVEFSVWLRVYINL